MKILIICGSPRKKSYSRVLSHFAYEYAKEKYKDADLLDLGKNMIEPFLGFNENYNKHTNNVIKSMEKYDVFIICSPIYDGLLSSAIKNLFEHLDYKGFIGKVAGFILMSSGKISYLQVQGQLTALMNYFTIISNPKAVYADKESFNEKMELADEGIKERIKNVVDSSIGLNSSIKLKK